MKNNGIEIYVHIPFCARKCDYCDFVSFACKEDRWDAYFSSLNNEIIKRSEITGKLPVVSCFFGGGTPSLPNSRYIVETLNLLRERFDFDPDAEITIEVNPNSASFNKLKDFRDCGFNRISIGLQSTVESELKVLSRLHNYDEFLVTYNDARRAGFDNINVDLMCAIPRQTKETLKLSLERIISLRPEHISAYSLIIEEGTPFFERYSNGEGLPSEDTEREMYYLVRDILLENGYKRYEISNYSLEGFECVHNKGYWKRVPYLGFGLSAASLYEEKRYLMHSDLERYIAGDYKMETEELSDDDIMAEFMFLGLRLTEGISRSEFKAKFQDDIEMFYEKEIQKLVSEGLLEAGERIKLTDRGFDLANYCMSEFIRD